MDHVKSAKLAYDAYEQRKGLSFEQAEGIAPLPAQLNRTEITNVLRARFWELISAILARNSRFAEISYVLTDPWNAIAVDEFVRRHGGFVDSKSHRRDVTETRFKKIVEDGEYDEFYGLIQFILQHPKCPGYFCVAIEHILKEQLSAFRVVGGDTLVPIASDEVAFSITEALTTTKDRSFQGSHAHLRKAAAELGEGNFANSVRESISAVESIARVLASGLITSS